MTPGELERRAAIEPGDARMRERRAQDGGVAGVRNRVEVVEEAPLAAQQRLVLERGQTGARPRTCAPA